MEKAVVIFSIVLIFSCEICGQEISKNEIIAIPDTVQIDLKKIMAVQEANFPPSIFPNMSVAKPKGYPLVRSRIDLAIIQELLIKEIPLKQAESDALRSKEDY